VPKLLGLDSVVVFEERQRVKEILWILDISLSDEKVSVGSLGSSPRPHDGQEKLTKDRVELQAENLQRSDRRMLFHLYQPYFVVAYFAGQVHRPLAYQRHPSQIHYLVNECISFCTVEVL
jgi:hypothetical protein